VIATRHENKIDFILSCIWSIIQKSTKRNTPMHVEKIPIRKLCLKFSAKYIQYFLKTFIWLFFTSCLTTANNAAEAGNIVIIGIQLIKNKRLRMAKFETQVHKRYNFPSMLNIRIYTSSNKFGGT
jgi:hypothetical protein